MNAGNPALLLSNGFHMRFETRRTKLFWSSCQQGQIPTSMLGACWEHCTRMQEARRCDPTFEFVFGRNAPQRVRRALAGQLRGC